MSLPPLPICISALLDVIDAPPPLPPPSPEPAYLDQAEEGDGSIAPRGAAAPRRESSCLAAKEGATFVSIADKAMQLKALKNALDPCSRKLKEQVQKAGVLTKKKPLAGATLRKLISAAGLGCAAESSIATVTARKE
jgi:hypothetical protein